MRKSRFVRGEASPDTLYKTIDIGKATCIEGTITGDYVAVGFDDGSVACLDCDTSDVIWRDTAMAMKISALCFSADNQYLAAVSQDMTACLFDMKGPKLIKRINLDVIPEAVSFAPNKPNKFYFYNRFSVFMASFDVEDGSNPVSKYTFMPNDSSVYNCISSASSSILLLSTESGYVYLYDLDKNSSIFQFKMERTVYSMKISESGNLAILNGNLIDVYDFEQLKRNEIKVIAHISCREMQNRWNDIAFSKGDVYAFCTSADSTMIRYAFSKGQLTRELGTQEQVVLKLVYIQSRNTLMGFTGEGEIWVWKALARDNALEWATQILGFEYIPESFICKETNDDWEVKIPDRETVHIHDETTVDISAPYVREGDCYTEYNEGIIIPYPF